MPSLRATLDSREPVAHHGGGGPVARRSSPTIPRDRRSSTARCRDARRRSSRRCSCSTGQTSARSSTSAAAWAGLLPLLRQEQHLRASSSTSSAARRSHGDCRAGVGDRCEVVSGASSSGPEGGDIYSSRTCCDWYDDDAIRIVRRAAPPMRSAKLVVLESLVHAGDEPEWSKTLDILMLAAPAAANVPDEYRGLLAAAGIELDRVVGDGPARSSGGRSRRPASRARCPRRRAARRTSRPSSRRRGTATMIGSIRFVSLAAAPLELGERLLDRRRSRGGRAAPARARSAAARAPGRCGGSRSAARPRAGSGSRRR